MSHQVLIYSRFPKAQMVRIGERYDLLDGKGKPPLETFSAEQLKPIRAMITAGGQVIPPAVLDSLPSLGAIICYGTGYDGVDFAETKKRIFAVGYHLPDAEGPEHPDGSFYDLLATSLYPFDGDRPAHIDAIDRLNELRRAGAPARPPGGRS